MDAARTQARLFARSDSRQIIPKVLLRAMAALALTCLAMVSYAVLTDRPHEAQIQTAVEVKSLLIQLNASPDGGTIVTDMEGNVLSRSGHGKAGFLSVVQNALDFERGRNNVTGNPPVHLIRFADGRIGLRDDASGWKINLIGFGQDNARVWRDIIDGDA